MISAVATALGAATVAITLLSGGFTAAESASASGTLIDAQIVEVYVFLLAAFTGFQIITKVPPLLHTPLMAATNAISAISLVASIVIAGAERPLLHQHHGRSCRGRRNDQRGRRIRHY